VLLQTPVPRLLTEIKIVPPLWGSGSIFRHFPTVPLRSTVGYLVIAPPGLGLSSRKQLSKTHPFSDGNVYNRISDAELIQIITRPGVDVGKSPLSPAFGATLKPAEVKAVIAYIRSIADPPYPTGRKKCEIIDWLAYSRPCLGLSCGAQVLSVSANKDPKVQRLQLKYISQLRAFAADAAAIHFPYPFYFSETLDVDEARQKQRTGQELINRAVVLINGERVTLDLQRAEADNPDSGR
jgi:hypothetical protein